MGCVWVGAPESLCRPGLCLARACVPPNCRSDPGLGFDRHHRNQPESLTHRVTPRELAPVLPEPTDFCRLILLRHPELDPQFANRAVGGGDATLARRGQGQVLAWLELFEDVAITEVHAATQPQCADPGRALAAKQQISLLTDPRLEDQGMGRWQGRAWEDLVKEEGELVQGFFTNIAEAVPPEGESLGQAVERMYSWWQEVAPKGLGQTLAVVTSGAMLSGFATAMLGMRLSRSVSLALPHGGVGVLDCFGNGARIATWNPTFAGWR